MNLDELKSTIVADYAAKNIGVIKDAKKEREINRENEEVLRIERLLNSDFQKRFGERKEVQPNQYNVLELTHCLKKAYFDRKLGSIVPMNSTTIHYGLLRSILLLSLGKIIGEQAKFTKELDYECKALDDTIKITGVADAITPTELYTIKYTKMLPVYLESRRIPEQYRVQAAMLAAMANLKKYRVIVMSSRNLKAKMLSEEPAKEQVEGVIENAVILHNSVKNDAVPIKKSPMYKWECKLCSYKNTCKKGGN